HQAQVTARAQFTRDMCITPGTLQQLPKFEPLPDVAKLTARKFLVAHDVLQLYRSCDAGLYVLTSPDC
ncbi:hypothetical protein, partial [Klebsiella aerogenes]|uniref:hypothetical protein n=1 Tax=Klebsiella aerogenes TaxID=548 RepID=UPI001CC57E47